MTLRVGVDVSALHRPESGIGRYTGALVDGLSARPDLDLRLFTQSSVDGVTAARPRWPARALRWAWGMGRLPVERWLGPLDVFHTSDWSHPAQRSGVAVTTVHDLGALDHPEWYDPEVAAIHRAHNARTAVRAGRIIAISEFTRSRFLAHYDVPEERVVVVPNGVGPEFTPADEHARLRVQRAYRLPLRFLVAVGTREARKNLLAAVQVLGRLAGEDPDLALVLVGPRPWEEARGVHGVSAWTGREVEERAAALGLRDRVHVLGSVPRADLVALYSSARALVFPSLYEGFGLPLLEAMACGCPVIASDRTALPEVVGAAGRVHDPEDIAGFATAVAELVADGEDRQRTVALGLERAAANSWGACVASTCAVYREAVDAT